MAVLKCEDGFENLPDKTYFLTKMLLNSSRLKNYDYIIKMDDDTEFNIQHHTLVEMDFFKEERNYIGPRLLTSEPTEHDYHFGKCTNDMELNITPFELKEKLSWGSGYFYILSRRSLTIINGCINENPSILKDFLYEDMMVGKILSENEINYDLYFSNNIITDLKRPRMTSLSRLIIQQQMPETSYTRIGFMPKSISRIKKVTFNFNKTEDANNDDDELSEKIKKEVSINQELDKKIKELSQKLNDNSKINNNSNNNNNTNNNSKINNTNNNNNSKINNTNNNNNSKISNTNIRNNNISNDTKTIPNPIMIRNARKITGKMTIRR
jgi:hypothetical protein